MVDVNNYVITHMVVLCVTVPLDLILVKAYFVQVCIYFINILNINIIIIDINECSTGNGGCAQTCTNINGSYACSCSTEYVLSNDGHNCTGILPIKYHCKKFL